MTIQEALNFSAIYPDLESLKMPFDISLKFYKINLEVNEAIKFYEKNLQDLILEYGERDENDEIKKTETGVALKPETAEECKGKLEELQKTEWEIFDLSFTKEEQKRLEEFSLTPAQVGAIYPFILST